jgi:UDP-N-acetylmuramoylalanine--D-glutamate ligase
VRLLVYGLGRSGGAVVARAVREGHEVAFVERREGGDDIALATALGATRLRDVDAWRADLCVAAPGVPLTHPDVVRLGALGTEVIGEVEWIWRTVPARLVGITGTAGKGSVTRWLTDVLVRAGVDAVAGGNIVPALAAVARPGATLVVELSSFQLERCPTLRPDVAVVLNLGVDHLDRHGDVETYHAAKRRLLTHLGPEQTFVYNADDPRLRAWAAATPARTRAYGVIGARGGATGGVTPGASGREALGAPGAETLDAPGGEALGVPAAEALDARLSSDGSSLLLGEEVLLRVDELGVQGRHQYGNALAVALAAQALGVERALLAAALGDFTGLPGRYAEVGTLGGVRFVEDSIATRQLAVEAALETTPGPIVWLAGGVDKGSDLAALESLARDKVTLLLGIGASGPQLVAQAPWLRAETVATADGRAMMREAVRRAWEHLAAVHGGRGSVLLAPLAASFDQFRDYADRGAAFREAVAALVEDVQALALLRGEEVAWTPSS